MNIRIISKKIYFLFLVGIVLYAISLALINQWQLRLHPNKQVLDAAKIRSDSAAPRGLHGLCVSGSLNKIIGAVLDN